MGLLSAQRNRIGGSGSGHRAGATDSQVDSRSAGLATAFAVAKGLKPFSALRSEGKLLLDLRGEENKLKAIKSLYTILRKRNPDRLKGEPKWTVDTEPIEVFEWLVKRWSDELAMYDDWYINNSYEVAASMEVKDADHEFRCVALWFLPHLQQHNYPFYKLFIGVTVCVGRLYNLRHWNGHNAEELSKEWIVDRADMDDDPELRAEAAAIVNYYEGEPIYWGKKLIENAYLPEEALQALENYKGDYPTPAFRKMMDAAYYAILHHDGNTIDDFDFIYRNWFLDDAGLTLDDTCRFAWYFWDIMWESVDEHMAALWNEAGHTPITQGVILTTKEPHGKIVPSDTIKLLFRFMEEANRACHEYFKEYPLSRIKLNTDDEGTN